MTNGAGWDPANVAKEWMKVCQSFEFQDPLMAISLWRSGPMPWMMNGGNSASLWTAFQGPNSFGGNMWGNVGDSVNLGNSTPEEKVDESDMTPEEKLASREKRAAQNAEKQKLVDNYNKMYSALEEYGNTLTEKTTPKKSEFMDVLKTYKANLSTSTKTEKLNEKFADLKAFFNKYSAKIKAAKLNSIGVSSANGTSYKTTVTNLNKAISANNDAKFGILKESDDGSYEWDDDIDIIGLLSEWNSNAATKSKHIMTRLAEKRKSLTDGAKKSQLDVLANNMHDKLLSVANEIDTEKLSEETITLLENATTDLEKFPSDKRLSEKDYSKAFDNLYRAIRIAKAEIANSELTEDFGFLREQNPYKDTKFVETTNADLKTEGLESAGNVTPPATVNPPAGKNVQAAIMNVVNPRGTDYNEGSTLGTKLYNEMHGLGSGDARKIIKEQVNRANIIGVIEGFEKISPNENILVYIWREFNMDFTDMNNIVKNVLRQAEYCGLKNSPEYKAVASGFEISGSIKYEKDGKTPEASDSFNVLGREPYGKSLVSDKSINGFYAKLKTLINKIKQQINT